MARPVKRKRLWIEHEETALEREWEEAVELHRRQEGDVTVIATVEVSVAIDDFGNPVATSTLYPSGVSPKPAAATTTVSGSSRSGSQVSSPLSASPSVSQSSITPSASPSSSISDSLSLSSSSVHILTDSSSTSSFSSSSSILPTSSLLPFVTQTDDGTPVVGGLPGASPTMSIFPTAHRGNGTAPAPPSGASPPVVAGAVVGSVGGTAVVLLVIVLLARYWKHKGGGERSSQGGESTHGLHTSPAPIMAHKPTRRSFLPPVAVGWINRLSGSHHKRSSSPTLPIPPPPERGFQKISGRKLPSQFPTGTEEGPVRRDFGDPDAIHPAMTQYRQTGISGTSSYYRDSQDTTNLYGAPNNHGPVMPIVPDHPNMDRDNRDTAQFFEGPPRIAAQRNHARSVPIAPMIPPLFAGARSATPSPPDEQRGYEKEQDYGARDETLMPSPARTPRYHPGQQPGRNSPAPNAPWAPNSQVRSPEPPGYFPQGQGQGQAHDSWPDSGYKPQRRR